MNAIERLNSLKTWAAESLEHEDTTNVIHDLNAVIEVVKRLNTKIEMIDDLTDWLEDLQHHRYNSLLGMLISEQLIQADQIHSPEDIASLLISDTVMQQYSTIIQSAANRAVAVIDNLNIKPWAHVVSSLPEEASWLVGKYDRAMDLFFLEKEEV